jgi:hypothetical protein
VSVETYELVITLLTMVAAACTIFGLVIRVLRGPHVAFMLDKAEIVLCNKKHKENITLLMASVANRKKYLFGDVAKKISAMVVYRAPVRDGKVGLNALIDLPWLRPFSASTQVSFQLKSEEDIRAVLENQFFDRQSVDIPQGRAGYLAVAYGIEKTDRLFLASNPPIEIHLPPPEKRHDTFTSCPFRLEVAGENLQSIYSEGTVIMANSWRNWSIPTEVITLFTPSRTRNLLLRIGFGRKKKVLDVKIPDEH